MAGEGRGRAGGGGGAGGLGARPGGGGGGYREGSALQVHVLSDKEHLLCHVAFPIIKAVRWSLIRANTEW